MAKWHTNLKRQKHFDKNNLSHNRVHFSINILQKTSDFQIFRRHVELWTAEKGLKPRYFIRDSLICPPIFARWQPSIGYPILGPMPPLLLFMISMLTGIKSYIRKYHAGKTAGELDRMAYWWRRWDARGDMHELRWDKITLF